MEFADEFYKRIGNNSGICPACDTKLKSDIKLFLIAKALFLTFGLVAIGMFIPLLLLPLIAGPNASGMYSMPRGRFSTGPGVLFTSSVLWVINAFNLVLSISFLSIAAFFNKKQAKREVKYSDASANRFDRPDKQVNGKRQK
jgi:hypothetical protein